MPSLAERWLQSAARRTLVRLHDQVGARGLVVAAAVPGLTALIDQHAAAVRDILTFGVDQPAGVAGVVLLAGYARGLLDQAAAEGKPVVVPADAPAWVGADWLCLRLLAVCALANAENEGRGPFTGGEPVPGIA